MKNRSLVFLAAVIAMAGCEKKECEYSRSVHYIRAVNILPVNFVPNEVWNYEVYTFKGGTDLTDTVSHYISTGNADSFYNIKDSVMILYKQEQDELDMRNRALLYVKAGYDYILKFPGISKTYFITGARAGDPTYSWKGPCVENRSSGFSAPSVTYPDSIHVNGTPARIDYVQYDIRFGDSYHIKIYK